MCSVFLLVTPINHIQYLLPCAMCLEAEAKENQTIASVMVSHPEYDRMKL